MAEDKKDDAAEGEEAPKNNKMMLILIILIVVLLAAVGGVLAVMMTSGKDAAAAEGGDAAVAEAAAAAPVAPPKGDPIYVSFAPAFTINFKDSSHAHFLQVEMQVLTYHEPAKDLLKLHMPRIRNDLILLFSDQDSRELGTGEGKEKLRQAALEKVRAIATESNPTLVIDDLYFTSFVMQ